MFYLVLSGRKLSNEICGLDARAEYRFPNGTTIGIGGANCQVPMRVLAEQAKYENKGDAPFYFNATSYCDLSGNWQG